MIILSAGLTCLLFLWVFCDSFKNITNVFISYPNLLSFLKNPNENIIVKFGFFVDIILLLVVMIMMGQTLDKMFGL